MSGGLLINYPGYPYTTSSFFPDNGIANLVGQLISDGNEVKILDFSGLETMAALIDDELSSKLEGIYPQLRKINENPNIVKELFELEKKIDINKEKNIEFVIDKTLKLITRENFDWVGFKLWAGWSFKHSIKIAESIKKHFPKIKIFAGGPQVDIFEELILEEAPVFDSLTFGEGEHVISELAKYSVGKSELESIPNQIFIKDGVVRKNPIERINRLDELPYPNYDIDLYYSKKQADYINIFSYDESRGCPMGCAFCLDPHKSGQKRREKSPTKIADDIEHIKRQYNVSAFRFSGSNTSPKLLERLAEQLIKRDLKIDYSIFSTVFEYNKERIIKLKNSGLFGVFFGVESGDDRILKEGLGKKINVKTISDALSLCKDNNIFITCSIIYPAPFDNEDSRSNTLKFLIDNLKDYPMASVILFPAGLYPNTIWASDYKRYGFELKVNSFKEYAKEAMNYNFKQLIPRTLWDELPYSLNGLSFKELLLETHRLNLDLMKNGVVMRIPDEAALVCHIISENFHEFNENITRSIFTGKLSVIKEIINKVDERNMANANM